MFVDFFTVKSTETNLHPLGFVSERERERERKTKRERGGESRIMAVMINITYIFKRTIAVTPHNPIRFATLIHRYTFR